MCGGTRGQAHLTVKIKRLFFFFFFLRFKVNNESQEILRQDTSKGAILHGSKPKQPCKVGRVTYTVRQERTIPIHAMCNHRLHRITPGKFTRCCFSFQENHSLLPSRSRFLEHTMLARGGARRFSDIGFSPMLALLIKAGILISVSSITALTGTSPTKAKRSPCRCISTSHGFGISLGHVHLRRKSVQSVSYYALFQG